MSNSLKLYFNKNFNLSDHPTLLATLQKKHQQAITAFQSYAPELLPQLQQHDGQFDIFFNKNNQLNICQTSNQQALYGMNPAIEVNDDVSDFISSAPFFSITQTAGTDEDVKDIEVLLVFGIGLGLHLKKLLERVKIKFMLIYEPCSSMLRCSTFQIDWKNFLDEATNLGTAVSLQINKPVSEVLDNLKQLIGFQSTIDKMHIYRHLCHPSYDEVIDYLLDASSDSKALTKSGMQFLGYNQSCNYVPLRSGSALLTLSPKKFVQHNEIFVKNLGALNTFYPELADVFRHYQPSNWLLTFDHNNQVNLYHQRRKCFLFRQRDDERMLILNSFRSEGAKGLSLLGQAIPWKLRDYQHFKTLKKIRDVEAKHANMPYKQAEQVNNLVVYGCSVLFDLEFITACMPDNLVYFEQEPDFFYASLFLVNWAEILKLFAREDKKLSLNIGQATNFSSAFFGLVQHSKQPNLESTVFLELSYSPEYDKQLQELKSDIQTSQAVSDYFDHARFGINHSLLNIEAGANFLKKHHGVPAYANYPVFIIGNGPSLDELIPYIKEYQQQAIIISCGTALSALMAYGIVPDFHAEAEQNRSTFSLISKVENAVQLKNINLISFSSVHPDTAALFKSTYLAFKEGEAATGFIKAFLPESERNSFIELKQAYPTVSNLAFSFITAAGFKSIYLFGVDFGQVEAGKHHSVKSIYFKADGTAVNDSEKNSPYEKAIPGNFRPTIKTKPEFDMARRTLEIAISRQPGIETYNCSDGAKIKGAIALLPSNILLEPFSTDKNVIQQQLFANFATLQHGEFKRFSFNNINFKMLEQWQEIFSETPSSLNEARLLLERSWLYLQQNVFCQNALLEVLYYNSLSYFYQSLQKILQRECQDEGALLSDFKLMSAFVVEFVVLTVSSLQDDELINCKATLFV